VEGDAFVPQLVRVGFDVEHDVLARPELLVQVWSDSRTSTGRWSARRSG
jgi:hypothetical protein